MTSTENFGFTLLRPQSCEVCDRRDGLFYCRGCLVTCYCSLDHQAAHKNVHERACTAVTEAKEDVTSAQDAYLEYLCFAHIICTAHERFTWARLLLRYFPGNITAVEKSLGLLRDLHEEDYWSIPSSHLREPTAQLVPALYIRLGRDQEALGFVKRWAVDELDDWSEGASGSTGALDADLFEFPEVWFRTGPGLSVGHTAAMLLIKIRLLFDVQALSTLTRILCGTFPQEIINLIYTELAGNAFSSRFIPMNGTPYLSLVAQMVKRQITLLVKTATLANPRVWHQMLRQLGLDVANVGPIQYTPDDEAFLWMQHLCQSWKETSGAVEALRKLMIVVGFVTDDFFP